MKHRAAAVCEFDRDRRPLLVDFGDRGREAAHVEVSVEVRDARRGDRLPRLVVPDELCRMVCESERANEIDRCNEVAVLEWDLIAAAVDVAELESRDPRCDASVQVAGADVGAAAAAADLDRPLQCGREAAAAEGASLAVRPWRLEALCRSDRRPSPA